MVCASSSLKELRAYVDKKQLADPEKGDLVRARSKEELLKRIRKVEAATRAYKASKAAKKCAKKASKSPSKKSPAKKGKKKAAAKK